jgi:hydroxymethylpyrimidine/phosphomethylpyrimidine kinase
MTTYDQPGADATAAPPCLLVVAGNDPSGGAGLCADIQTAALHGVHTLPVVASVTVQDTRNVSRVVNTEPALLRAQLDCVLDDIQRICAVKLGLLATPAQVKVVASALRALPPQTPVVLDPVLKAGGGGRLSEDSLEQVLVEELLPLATVATPNRYELFQLAPHFVDVRDAARALARRTGTLILTTGADDAAAMGADRVENIAITADGHLERWLWPRLAARYHGSGCTMSAALAASLARGQTLDEAVLHAQRFTYDALSAGFAPGRGQRVPRRVVNSPHG